VGLRNVIGLMGKILYVCKRISINVYKKPIFKIRCIGGATELYSAGARVLYVRKRTAMHVYQCIYSKLIILGRTAAFHSARGRVSGYSANSRDCYPRR